MKQAIKNFPMFLWVVINNWAGYATGGLIVASTTLYFFWRDKPMPRIVGFILSGVFLLMAFYKAWLDQYTRAEKLQSDLETATMPEFEVVIAQSLAVYHSVEKATIMLVQLGVLNRGASSPVRYIKAHYKSQSLNRDVEVVFLPKEEQDRAFPQQQLTMEHEVGNLADNARLPIPARGIVPGKVFVRVPGDRTGEIQGKNFVMTITVSDYLGKEYSGWFPNDEQPPFNLPFHQLN